MEILAKTKKVPQGVWIEGRITEVMTCAITLDERGFHMDNIHENWKKIDLHIQAEQNHTGAIGPQMKVDEIIRSFKVSHPCPPFEYMISDSAGKACEGRMG